MGRTGCGREGAPNLAFQPFDQDPFFMASEWLSDTPHGPDKRRKQRQFLALLAVELVQRFRAEEASLRSNSDEALKVCRMENHRMARQIMTLIRRADLGLAIEPSLRALLKAWRRHQQRTCVFDDRN